MAAVFLLKPFGSPPPLHEKFLAEHIAVMQMVDNSRLSRAYTVGLLALTFWAIVLNVCGGNIPRLPYAQLIRRNIGLLAAVGIATLLTYELLSLPMLIGALAVLVGGALLRKFTPARWQWLAGGVFIAAFVMVFSVRGFLRVPFLPDGYLAMAEGHYALMLGQGDRLAAGLVLGHNVQLNYGLGPALPLGIWERHFGLLDFAGHIHIVQYSQILYLLLTIAALVLWKRNIWFILFGVLLIGPFVGTGDAATLFANQAGWRSIGFPVLIIAFVSTRTWPMVHRSLALGFLASCLLLYNPETGVALSLACACFALAQSRKWRDHLKVIACGLAGFVAAGMLTLICYRIGLGAWPVWEPESLLIHLSRFGSGYAGVPMVFNALAALLLVHSAYLGLLLFWKWRQRGLNFEDAVRLAMVVAILLWFPYYVNRPVDWNLWTFLLPYCILIAHWFEPDYLRRARLPAWRGVLGVRVAVLTAVLLPLLLTKNLREIPANLTPLGERPPGSQVSGVLVEPPTAQELQSQARFLAKQEASTLFFSRHPYILSLMTGRFNALPVQDVFSETASNREFDKLVRNIAGSSAQRLLFDEDFQDEYLISFYDRLRLRLSTQFVQRGAEANWQVWVRR